MDGCIFDYPDWLQHYNDYWSLKLTSDLEWLNIHLVAVIEFKHGDKEIEKVFTGQVKQAMREKEQLIVRVRASGNTLSVYPRWRTAKVNIDYHIAVEKHCYTRSWTA